MLPEMWEGDGEEAAHKYWRDDWITKDEDDDEIPPEGEWQVISNIAK